MRLTLLGTQGWIPTGRRETTCITLDGDGVLFIFDAGTGLRRLLEPPAAELLAAAGELHLFLTHYHLDHVCGLAYLPGIFADRRLTVHVPGADLNGVDPERGVAGLIRSPFNPRPWADIPVVETHVLAADNDIAGHSVRLRPQQHPDTTVAYRVDDLFVLATDTVADPGTADFARGARILAHEAWTDGSDDYPGLSPAYAELVRATSSGHTAAPDAARIAADAGVDELILMHLNPFLDEAAYGRLEAAAHATFPGARVRPDLHCRQIRE